MMVHTALTENPTKKATIFISCQTTHHESLKKLHDNLKKDSQFCHNLKIFFRSQSFTKKNATKQWIKNQATTSTIKRKQSKQKEKKTQYYLVQSTIQQVR